MDNLDRYTYEVFEQDPVKYREYQRAIKLALIDKKAEAEEPPKCVTIVACTDTREILFKILIFLGLSSW